MKKILALLLALITLISLFGCRRLGESDETTALPAVADTDEETTEEETTAAPPRTTLSLVMVGDVLLHEKVSESGLQTDGSYNYDHLFKNIKNEVESADIAIANQEVILGGKDLGISGYPAFNGAFEVGDALVAVGFDVVLHGTNHALDKGKTGLLNCLNFWETTYPDIAVLGVYKSQAERDSIYTYEQNGITVSILNYTYGTNGIALPSDMPYCVNLMDKQHEAQLRTDIAKARESSDFVIVCPHWGTEYSLTTDSWQDYWTDVFFECGVDLVIGTHPHVIEPVEMKNENGRQMLVYYSLGNFINSTARTGSGVANQMVGAMATVTLDRNDAGSVYIKEYGVDPLVTQVASGQGAMTAYRLADYTEALAAENEIVRSDSAFSLEYCKKLCRDVFGELYKEN